MKWWHKALIGIAVYEVGAYIYNGWIAPNQANWPAAPFDLISNVIPQTQSAQ
jgi:hypothetical protein